MTDVPPVKEGWSTMRCTNAGTLSRVAAAILFACCALWMSCGNGGGQIHTCTLNGYVSPQAGTADHTVPPPGNQVQFKLAYSGTCDPPPMTIKGTWVSTDPANTRIDPDTGLATCLKATTTPSQVRFDAAPGYAWNYDTATLTCK